MEKKSVQPLGVISDHNSVYLFGYDPFTDLYKFQIDSSQDGSVFQRYLSDIRIEDKNRRPVTIANCRNFRLSRTKNGLVLSYLYRVGNRWSLTIAKSADLTRFRKFSVISTIRETGSIVPEYLHQNSYVLYFGEKSIHVAYSSDLKTWEKDTEPLIRPKKDYFGLSYPHLIQTMVTEYGITVFFSLIQGSGQQSLNVIYLDKNNPKKIIYETKDALWETPKEWLNKTISPVGVINYRGQLLSYWNLGEEDLAVISHVLPHPKHSSFTAFPQLLLKKLRENPILKPIEEHDWESRATFNPAALYDQNKIHLVYRAIGDDDVSVLGHAESRDGIHFDYRSTEPIYTPNEPFECSNPYRPKTGHSPFASGGGCYGGCEDPRLTRIEDKVYMTYVAYNGYSHPRVAITSTKIEDFRSRRWNWKKPVLISPPNVVDKNACLFPEKINGKYVMLHRIFPNILIDFLDDLDFDGKTYLKGEYMIKPRSNGWDSRKVGAGAPPIRTKLGWLLLYHAVGEQDAGRYKMGAMILDIKDPTHVLYRSHKPILEPQEWYENEGHKAGVAYPCGAVVVRNQLLAYYGGADKVICAAGTPLDTFLTELKRSHTPELTTVSHISN